MEFGIHHYDESNKARIFLGFFSLKISLSYLEDGYDKAISFDKLGFNIKNNDITRCYYWKKIFKRPVNHQAGE